MKKLYSVMITLAMVISLAACGSEPNTVIEKVIEQESEQESKQELKQEQEGIWLREEGFFAAGGSIVANEGEIDPDNLYTDSSGQTVHGDHATVEYQIPMNAKSKSMVFLHGMNLSGRSWSTTPDGREGFREMFLRDGYSVYLVDEPRRGMSGRSTEEAVVPRNNIDQMWFDQSRLGHWPDLFDGVQFSDDEEALEQFYRMMTPDIGSLDPSIVTSSMIKVLERSGPSIFFTHSAGGAMGWDIAMNTDKVIAIVAMEPGTFVFPEGELPKAIPNRFSDLTGFSGGTIRIACLGLLANDQTENL